MEKEPCWETRQMKCPEGEHMATLLIEWADTDGQPTIRSIECDNPLLSGIDNWDCQWQCWEKIQAELANEH